MIITTARKPSSKTRIFCKHLGRFTGWKYVTRGKSSLQDLAVEPFLLVGEYKGNPGSFSFFSNGKCVLSIRANVSLDKDIRVGVEPVIQGNSSLALDLSRITGLRAGEGSERIIKIEKNIEFTFEGKSYIKLTMLEVRGEESARSI
jgi:U3 small nucleolar ribonucleoprotein protein IMP4